MTNVKLKPLISSICSNLQCKTQYIEFSIKDKKIEQQFFLESVNIWYFALKTFSITPNRQIFIFIDGKIYLEAYNEFIWPLKYS